MWLFFSIMHNRKSNVKDSTAIDRCEHLEDDDLHTLDLGDVD